VSPFELWQLQTFHDYSIDQVRSCFCVNSGIPMRITVRSDTIARIVRLSDSSIVTDPYFLTIDSLFALIRKSTNDSLVVRYNSQYGYPEYLDIDPQSHPVDGGVLYETSNLQVQTGFR
jgi:hypothetical protein